MSKPTPTAASVAVLPWIAGFLKPYSGKVAAAIVFLLLIGRGYLQLRKKISIFEKILLGAIFPACVLLSVTGPLFLHGKAFLLLDQVLNTRLTLAKYYLKPEYISLFGRRLSEITSAQLTMDNAYVFCLIAYGIIPFIGVCILYMYMIVRLLKQDETVMLAVVLALAAAGLTEPFLFNTAFKNIAFVLIGQEIYRSLGGRKDREIGICLGNGRKIDMDLTGAAQMCRTIRTRLKQKKRILSAGILAGVIIAAAAALMVDLPKGYVTARDNCEDITEDIIRYEEDAPEYMGYERMGDFEPGDEIQYFSGDIVRMERIRLVAMCVLLGGLLGGILAFII